MSLTLRPSVVAGVLAEFGQIGTENADAMPTLARFGMTKKHKERGTYSTKTTRKKIQFNTLIT